MTSIINADSEVRMAKKIAQLTKVIVQLNCRNEDHASNEKRLVETYENDIQEILADARLRLEKYRNKLMTAIDGKEHDNIIKEIHSSYESEKERILKDIEKTRVASEKAMLDKYQLLEQVYRQKFADGANELKSLRHEFMKHQSHFEQVWNSGR